MSAQILYGKPCAESIYGKIRKFSETGSIGKLFMIGFDNPEWNQYSDSLVKTAFQNGIECEKVSVQNGIEPKNFFSIAEEASKCDKVSGIIIQQPLPQAYVEAVNFVTAEKDVDCLNPLSVAKMYYAASGIRPATPQAVIRLLDFYGIDLAGKNLTVIGRGNSVGKPLALLALQRNATVTVCHTKTVDLASVCRKSDIIVSACGASNLVTKDFVNENSVVIDVGLSFCNGKTCGDVDKEVYEICKAVSPVPGGVGPVTRAVLFENLMKASLRKYDD